MRVLLVAGADEAGETVTRELGRAGLSPSCFRVDSLEALEAALVREQWDLPIARPLPRLDSLRAFALVQEGELDLPFIIVSDGLSEEAAVEAMRAGVRDCLTEATLGRLGPLAARELREANRRAERRRIEDQLVVSDRMVSVGTLAAGVAHEINNPLATVLANLELATRETADLLTDQGELPRLIDLRDELRDAREAAARVRTIVRDLKIFSRADDETTGRSICSGCSSRRSGWPGMKCATARAW